MQVAKLQAALEAEKLQPSDGPEKEKQNKTRTEHDLNPRPAMKARSDDGPDCEGGERARGPQLKANERRHESRAAKDRHEDGQLLNADAKGNLETLVSEDLQPGQDNRLTKIRSRAASEEDQLQGEALRGMPNLEVIVCNANVESSLSPGKADIKTMDKTWSHVTTRCNKDMQN